MTEYNYLFKKELALLHDIEAAVTVEQTATPRFYRYRPVPCYVERGNGGSP